MERLNFNVCQCSSNLENLTFVYFLKRFFEELLEFAKEPSIDEFADVMLMLSLMIWSITKRVVVLPYADIALAKGRKRLEKHGCIRSYRNRCIKQKGE